MTYKEIFCIDNFFSEDDLQRIEDSITNRLPGNNMILPYGPFANELIANYVNLIQDTDLIAWLKEKISITVCCNLSFDKVARVKLFLPWDIHSDYYVNECQEGYKPYYNFLIPLESVQSRTVIFDQTTNNSPNFSDYKEKNMPATNPPDEDFWQENLSMCWPQDRPFVSIKKIMPWQQRGQLQGFPSKYFHSSDNFHTKLKKPKQFIQIRTSTSL